MENYWLFYLLAFIAEIIGTLSGFGSSILFIPIASLFFDFHTVLGITAIFHVFSNISKIYLFRKGIDNNIALKMGIPAIIAVILGAFITRYMPQFQLEFFMSILIFFMGIFLFFYNNKRIRKTDQNLRIGGAVSGFIAGLVGTGGAIRGLTLAAFNLEKNVFIATSALIDLGVDGSRALVYFINGFVQREFLLMLPFLLTISILGTWIGKQLLDFIPQKMFKSLVLSIIVTTALAQILLHVFNLLAK
jgi:uncharacterized membrane protein YfcA